MTELAKKPYDRARLEVIAALAEGTILEIGGDREVIEYFGSLAKEAMPAAIDRLPEGRFGAAVAYDSLLELPRDAVKSALSEISRVLAPGAPLLVTLTSLDRREAEELAESIGAFDRIRVEARRPYRFEPPLTRVFLSARRR